MNKPEDPPAGTEPARYNRHFLSCDWGTSSFRLLLADKETGRVAGSLSTPDGAKAVYGRWEHQKEREQGKPGELALREKQKLFFLDFLRRKIKDLEKKLAADLRGRPVIVSGMASSTIGIKNLPYSELPQRLDAPDIRHEIFPADTSFPHDLLLISGICADEDVMRGEETQLIGLHREYGFTEALCILPGTHSKHLKIEKGELTGFKTYMTGELFQLLGTHSILRGSLSTGNEEPDLKSFYRGVDRGRSGNLLHTLFTIRARGLVGHREAESARDFLSGLLIGMELAELLPFSGEEVIVAGNGRLQEYYSCALRHFGVPHKADRNPDHRTLQGHLALLNLFC